MAVRRALLEAGIAVAAEPRGVAAAVGALLADARARSRIAPTGAPERGAHRCRQAHTTNTRPRPCSTGSQIAAPARRACDDRAQARAAFAELDGPVAVKILDADGLHKTDIGGVHLGIATPTELDEALDRARGHRRYPIPGRGHGAGRGRPRPRSPPRSGLRPDPAARARRNDRGGPRRRRHPPGPAHPARKPPRCPASWPGAHCSTAGGAAPSSIRPSSVGSQRGSATCSWPTPNSTRSRSTRSALTADGLIALDAVVLTRAASKEAADAHPDQ